MKPLSSFLLAAMFAPPCVIGGCKQIAAEVDGKHYYAVFDDVGELRETSEVVLSNGAVIGNVSAIDTDGEQVGIKFAVMDRYTKHVRIGSILYVDSDGPNLTIENCAAEERRAREGHRFEGRGTLGKTARKALCVAKDGWEKVKDLF